MTAQDWLLLFGGVATGTVGLTLIALAARGFGVAVEDEHVALVTRFGKLVAKLDQPGLVMLPSKWLPWVDVEHVSLARDFRVIHDLHVNDARGTSVLTDLWVELRVVDAEKALFAVEDWEQATQNVVVHAAMSILGSLEFQQILDDRSELGARLQREVSIETTRWGVQVERVFVRNISLSPEVARQVFGSVATRLERARAVLVEQGRLDAALLEADTANKVASVVASAKAQYPLAVGRALDRLQATPEVFSAYNELYALSQLRGPRTVAFQGFGSKEVRALDAAMLPEPTTGPLVLK